MRLVLRRGNTARRLPEGASQPTNRSRFCPSATKRGGYGNSTQSLWFSSETDGLEGFSALDRPMLWPSIRRRVVHDPHESPPLTNPTSYLSSSDSANTSSSSSASMCRDFLTDGAQFSRSACSGQMPVTANRTMARASDCVTFALSATIMAARKAPPGRKAPAASLS